MLGSAEGPRRGCGGVSREGGAGRVDVAGGQVEGQAARVCAGPSLAGEGSSPYAGKNKEAPLAGGRGL